MKVPDAFEHHRDCFVCGPENPHGLQVSFYRNADGSITGRTSCDDAYSSYDGVLHGGIVAGLLDGAMTHCLLFRNVEAMTAELTVRYLKPVKPNVPLSVTARILRARDSFYILSGVIVQSDRICSRATAKFMRTSTH